MRQSRSVDGRAHTAYTVHRTASRVGLACGIVALACGPDVVPSSAEGTTSGPPATTTSAPSTSTDRSGATGSSAAQSDDASPPPHPDGSTASADATAGSRDSTTLATETSTTSGATTTDDEATATSTTSDPALPCGNGALDPGEECDDGNTDDADACTAACTIATCGDGIVWLSQEECDDANADEADACTSACEERFPFVYLALHQFTDGMARYAAEDDTWEILASPSTLAAANVGGLAWDGQTLYCATTGTGALLRYDAVADAWELETLGPNGMQDAGPTSGEYTGLVWAEDAFYLVLEDPPEWAPLSIWAYRDGMWSATLVDAGLSSAIDWDPVAHELYVRKYSQLGLVVLDTITDQVVRETFDDTVVGWPGRDGSFVDGFVYAVPWVGPLTRIDGQTGVALDTGVTPTSPVPSTAADPYKGHIYLGGTNAFANHLERYDVETGAVTVLSPAPIDFSPLLATTNLVVAYPPP